MPFDDLLEEGDLLRRSLVSTQNERYFFGRLGPCLGKQLDISCRAAITLEFSAVVFLAPLHDQHLAPFFTFFQFADDQ